MSKYVIEGNINFFDELYKSLDAEDADNDDSNRCLITNTLLSEHYVQLECGHKFNYQPLFFDVQNHKSMFNLMEGTSSKLAMNEIRCPYCRKKQTTMLPYHDELGLPKINGVNFYDATIKGGPYGKCAYQVPSPTFDPALPLSETNQPMCACNAVFSTTLCSGYFTGIQMDAKYYCAVHKKMMLKKYKEDAKAKVKASLLLAKTQAKEAKLLAKAQEKEAKLLAKAQEKEAKLLAKAQEKEANAQAKKAKSLA